MADGKLVVAVGASRSGKTAWVLKQLAPEKRVLIWDPEGQYQLPGLKVVRSKVELIADVQRPGPGRYAYVPGSMDDFNYWAECAFVFARLGDAHGQKSAVVAEELADVTSPGKAPPGWGMFVRRGLKRNCDIYAITQRPAESDKTIMGNASIIHCCGLQRANDRVYMAREMDVPPDAIGSLDRSKLEYLHKDMRSGEGVREFLTF